MKTNKFYKLLDLVMILALVSAPLAYGVDDILKNDKVKLGKPTNPATDKTIEFNKGSGALNPKIKLNGSTGRLQFTNNGTNFSNLGSGSGGGGGINLIAENNPGFEEGTAQWTNSGGGATFTTSGTTPGYELLSGVFNSSAASQTLSSTAVSIPSGLQGTPCVGSFWYKTAESTNKYKIQVYDGTNVLAESTLEPTSGVWDKFNGYAGFTCPSSGTILVRLMSTGDAADISVDQGVLGEKALGATNPLSAGSVFSVATSTCPSGSLIADGSAVSRTNYATLFAKLGITHGQGDGSTTFNVPDYRGRFLRGVNGGSSNDPDAASRTAMATGGNTGNNVGSLQSDEFKSHTHDVVEGRWYVYSSGSQTAWSNLSGSVAKTTTATGGSESRPKNAYVTYCVQTDGSSPSIRADATGFSQKALIGDGLAFLATSTSTSPVNFNLTAFGTKTFTGGATAPTVANDLAVKFNNIPEGEYTVYFNAPMVAYGTGASSSVCQFRIWDGTTAIATTPLSVVSVTGLTNRNQTGYIAGKVKYTAFQASKEFSLQLTKQGGSGTHDCRIEADGNNTLIEAGIVPVNSSANIPVVFKGMVTSSSSGRVRHEYAVVQTIGSDCSSSPCTIDSQSGSWLTSMTRAGVGDYTLNFAAGTFSGKPACSVIFDDWQVYNAGPLTSSSWRFNTSTSTGTLTDGQNFLIQCTGPN